MIPSLSMWSFDALIEKEGWNQIDFIEKAAAMGFTQVELLSYYMDRESNRARVLDAARRAGIGISCYTVLSDFTPRTAYDDSSLERDIANAAALGAAFIRLLSGGEVRSESGKTAVCRGLKNAAGKAAAAGVVPVVENIGPYCGSAAELLEIVERTGAGNLRVNYDTANALLCGEDPLEELKKLEDLVSYVHLKDFAVEGCGEFLPDAERGWRIQSSRSGLKMSGTVSGCGQAGNAGVMAHLKKTGYGGHVSIEYESDISPEESVASSFEFLKARL